MQWQLQEQPNEKDVAQLSAEININNYLATLLVQRGIRSYEEAKHYFRPSMDDLHDPFLMKDMDKAVDRLNEAMSGEEKIMVFGDYDVDGTTAVTTVYGFLSKYYDNLMYYIPDRYSEGYGISTQGIDHAKANGVTLIISLDCGIKAVEKIAYAKELGIDFIICDHHRPGKKLPPAVAILDAKQEDCNYPYDELCGCGVGFKFMQAFCLQNTIDLDELYPFLDLVSVGTASDIVPITGENRALAFFGIEQLNTNPRPGLKALIDVAGYKDRLTVSNIVFGLGPRINAAGRIKHAMGAVELLLSETAEQANESADVINDHNQLRRDFDQSITEEALQMIESSPTYNTAKSTVLYKQDWHKGVIGIVASRCIEKVYRPTIIFTKSNGVAAGSARSVAGFDVYEAISECSELLEQFGGHTYAAGMTMAIENIDKFRVKFDEVVAARITAEQLVQKVDVDVELPLSAITDKFYSVLSQMGPFGPKNMQPVFVSRGVTDTGRSRIVKETHLKISVEQPDGGRAEGIAFGMGEKYEEIAKGAPFDLCYTLEENHFNGKTTIQLMVKDIKMTGE